MSVPTFDVCVVGAGLAGLAAARELERSGAAVALLSPPPKANGFKVGESLAGAAVLILKDLGLDFLLRETGQQASQGTVSAWGTKELVATDFITSPHGSGWHLDRRAFEQAMFHEVLQSSVQYFDDQFVKTSRQQNHWVVDGNKSSLKAGWVIDATGRRACFARSQGAVRHDDNRQLAVIRWFRADAEDVETRTLVETGEHGWWYTACLPGQVRVGAFHGEGPRLVRMFRDRNAWNQTLAATQYIQRQFRGGYELTVPKLVQACGSHLDPVCGWNWVAVGDAALAFDPISAQGMFSALYTGLRAAQSIVRNVPMIQYAKRLRSIREAYLINASHAYEEVHFSTY